MFSKVWWAHLDLNQESADYESDALTVMLQAQELSILPNPKTNRSRSITQLLRQCNQHLLQNHCTLLIVFQFVSIVVSLTFLI
jgi:hypothetical protein